MYVTRRKNIMRTHVPRKQFPIVHERVFEKFVPLLNHPHTSSKVKRSAPKRNSRKLCSFWRWSSSIEVTPAHSLSQGDKSGPEFHQGVDMHPFFFFYKNAVLPAQAEYSYFFCWFWAEIFMWIFLDYGNKKRTMPTQRQIICPIMTLTALRPVQTGNVWRPNTIKHCWWPNILPFGHLVWCCLIVFDRVWSCLIKFEDHQAFDQTT